MFYSQVDVSILVAIMQTPDALSVFFPAYNEEKNISTTVEKAIKVLHDLKIPDWEILIVNDGSKDRTGEIADALSKKYQGVLAIHQVNGGYGAALRAGFKNAKYDLVVYTDADGQFDFSEVAKFLDNAGEADIIYGYRIKRQDPIYRLLFAKGWALSLFLFFGLRLKDVDCGFKLVKKGVLAQIAKKFPLESSRGGMINAELAIKAKKLGHDIAQVGVDHYPRLAGRPTGANLKVILQSYIDLLKLWFKLLG